MECIKNKRGKWKHGQERVAEVVASYFRDLFSLSNPNDFDYVLNQVDHCIMHHMYMMLQDLFTEDEVLMFIH